MIFSDRGRAYWLKVHEIPDVGPGGKGKSIANLVSMEEGEKIAALLAVKEFEDDKFIVMGTRAGVVKKTELSAFSNPRAGGIIAMGVEEGDAVIAVQVTDGTGEIFIGTRDGMAIRFPEDDVRPMGRTAYGVRGITLRDDDYVVAMEVVKPGGTLLTVTEHGYGKRTEIDEYRVQSRGGVGIINIETTRPQRRGRRRRLRAGRRRAAADHAAGHDPADADQRRPRDRPRDAGREAHRHRGRRPGRLDRAAGGEGRRGRPEPPSQNRSAVCAATICALVVAADLARRRARVAPEAADPRRSSSAPRACATAPRSPNIRHDELRAADAGHRHQTSTSSASSPEQREPLRIAAVAEEVEASAPTKPRSRSARRRLPGRNSDAITRVLKAESRRRQSAARTRRFRPNGASCARRAAHARKCRRGAAQAHDRERHGCGSASTTRPNPTSTSTERTATLVTKDVTVTAQVRTPDGASADDAGRDHAARRRAGRAGRRGQVDHHQRPRRDVDRHGRDDVVGGPDQIR